MIWKREEFPDMKLEIRLKSGFGNWNSGVCDNSPAKTRLSSSMCAWTVLAATTVPFSTWCLWWTAPATMTLTAQWFRRTDPLRTHSTSNTPCGNEPLDWSVHFVHCFARSFWCDRSTSNIRLAYSLSFRHRIEFLRSTKPPSPRDARAHASTNATLGVYTWFSRSNKNSERNWNIWPANLFRFRSLSRHFARNCKLL